MSQSCSLENLHLKKAALHCPQRSLCDDMRNSVKEYGGVKKSEMI